MCGISGLIAEVSRDEGIRIVTEMNRLLDHRGPDDRGYWATNGFAFGMTRLSIIDLDTGHQPMWSGGNEGEGVGVIFNGEIYNYKEIKQQLVQEGCVFRTKSDTEVILQLYLNKGIEGIHELNGMFSICIYDARSNNVFLIRDRMGIKPLYYAQLENKFIFSSEIKAIMAGLENKPALNYQSASHFLSLRYVPPPETIWENIYKLEPGHYLSYSLDKKAFQIFKYWDLKFDSGHFEQDRDYIGEFSRLFNDSVNKRLVAADVPVGVFLSGGLDSSCISAAAIESGHRSFHTFSVAFDGDQEFSELEYARQVSGHIKSIHHDVFINQNDFINYLHEMVYYSDEPLADLTSVPLYYLSKEARKYVKVVLSGEGSDELLAGYDMDRLASRLDTLKRIKSFTPDLFLRCISSLGRGKYAKLSSYMRNNEYHKICSDTPLHISYSLKTAEKDRMLISNVHGQSTDSLIKTWFDGAVSNEPVDVLQQSYWKTWLVEDLLMKADKMSMAASLEVRVPFLDHKLVEFSSRLPMSLKVGDRYSGYESKRILRQYARNRLPGNIINRKKKGFPLPVYKWMQGGLGKWAEDYLESTRKNLEHIIRPEYSSRLLKRARNGDLAAAHNIWTIIVFSLWLDRWQAA